MEALYEYLKMLVSLVVIAFFCGVGFTAGAQLAFKNFNGFVVLLSDTTTPANKTRDGE